MPSHRSDPARHRLAFALMLSSGFAGLGYQIVWTQQCALWLGHESAAVLAVVTAFFGGLCVGAFVLGPRVERSLRPERAYAACEAVIAGWSLALAVLLAPVSRLMLDLTGAQPEPLWQWTVAFIGCFVLLLPATAAMGATLPAMTRVVARAGSGGRTLASLYAANTFGAVAGVLASAFWLLPEWGLTRSTLFCAALNLFCAVAALRLVPGEAAPLAAEPGRRIDGRLGTLAATGLLGIGYEVLVVRVLSQVAEDTVYTFAMLLAVYLVGSAAGAAFYARWLAGRHDGDRLRTQLLCAQAITCLAGALALWEAADIHHVVLHALGAGMPSALACEAALAIAAFGLPTLVMGALFSHLCVQARDDGHGFGRALGFNTFGAALAPPLFGVLAVPAIGPKFALLGVAAGYMLLALPRGLRSPALWLPAGAAAALAVWAPMLAFVDVPDGGRILRYEEGAMAAVSVVEDADGVARLRIDNRQQEGSSATVLADARQALLPLLLHPSPRHALFLGLGTGVTASAAAADRSLQVDAVELLPEVIAVADEFERAFADGTPHATPHLIHADARRFVQTTDRRYDLIVADNFHPARSGSGALYTVEHFEAVRRRLNDGGVFCQWLPLHQLDLPTLRSIVQSFIAVNPQGFAMLATNSLETPVLGLVARRDGEHFSLDAVRAHMSSLAQPLQLAGYGLFDEWALLGGFVAGPPALRRFAGDAPLNTDDRPVVAYRAPRVTYAPDAPPRERLWALLAELRIEASQLLSGAASDDTRRLGDYWAARDRFIEAGRGVQPSSDPRRMLAQVRDPLLAVLRTSPDFRPAYDPLLRIGVALMRSDPDAARSLLGELARLQPARGEAAQALAALEAGAAR